VITHPVLQRLVGAGIRLGLERVEAFLHELGDPHLAVPVVHVAGTNGKGSTCAFLESALVAGGKRVGVFTSPHLQHVNERIRIQGRPIDDATLSALLEEVVSRARVWATDALPHLGVEEQPLTYFEAMTAAAFLHLSRCDLDVAVIEVGLGGRLDATNVVSASVSAITSVGLDHCDKLGPDHASVAAEKAGILRRDVPAVIGPLSREALAVVRSMAGERGTPLWVAGAQFRTGGSADTFSWEDDELRLAELSSGLPGHHQVENAGVAIAALRLLGRQHPSLAVSEAALRHGLAHAMNPGRCEWLSSNLLVDGAHNVEGARRLADYLRGLPRSARRTLLLGMGCDKNPRSVAAALSGEVDRVLTTSCRHPRAHTPGGLAEVLVGLDVPVMPAGPVESALPLARDGGGLVVVAGSLYLAGAIRDLVGAT